MDGGKRRAPASEQFCNYGGVDRDDENSQNSRLKKIPIFSRRQEISGISRTSATTPGWQEQSPPAKLLCMKLGILGFYTRKTL
jgi:hypothetical protein